MELDGILKAWMRNVVPNRARITVTTSASRYSRAVDFSTADSAAGAPAATSGLGCFAIWVANLCLPQFRQRKLRRGLLGRFLAVPLPLRQLFAAQADLDREYLMMLRTAFAYNHVVGRGIAAALEEFLQLRLEIHGLELLPVNRIKNMTVHEGSGSRHTAIEIDCRDHGLEGVHQQSFLCPPAALFLALSQSQESPQNNPLRNRMQ